MTNIHLIDNGRLKCSCKGWWCKICNATNKQVEWHNEIMKFGIDKQVMLDNLNEINEYVNKVEAYTMYQYLTKEITKDKLNEEVNAYIPNKTIYKHKKKSEIKDTSNLVNPDEECVFDWDWPRSRCKYCNNIKKYAKWQRCLRFIWDIKNNTSDENKTIDDSKKQWETLGSTVIKNEISNTENKSDTINQTEEKNNKVETPKKKRWRKKKEN